MVSEVVVTSSLEALPPRPPTPPREKSLEAEKQKQLLARPSLNPRRSLQTPPDYSPYSSDLSDPLSRRARKRVGFSSQTEYCDAPTYVKGTRKQPTPASATSTRSLSGPLKSILKPSPPAVPNPLDPSGATDEATRHASIITMLESTTKQLAGADRASKLDAYSVLVRALKTSNNLPDRIALQDKMSLFTQFIQRDVSAMSEETGELDSSLSNHASTLLITFLSFPAIASTISSEFGVFIIDHCIRTFDDTTAPKDVVRHLMQVVASQDFTPKVMTADRVGRLVSSLHRIEEHLKGKSIIMSRLLIYRRLIKQSKAHMVTHSDWLLDLFTDMLSSIKEIRATAVALGLEASFSIAKEKQLSKRVMEILELTMDDTKYIQYYAGRLKVMAKSKDNNDSMAVPQIWSVIILLLRYPVTKWDFFGPWLEIIQMCFNNADLQTKFEANYAWNRLVYCTQLNHQSFSKIIATIRQPYESQLRRKRLPEELRRVVVGSLCNLYYYAFKPNTGADHTSSFWDSCVPQLMAAMVSPELSPKSPDRTPSVWQSQIPQATQILTALFNSTTPRIWKEDHIADSPLVKIDELPALDPKWVRRNASKVFSVVEPILLKTYLDLSDTGSATAKLWQTLVGTVAFAASKEVKVSTDTAVFMAHALTFLLRVWSRGISNHTAGNKASRQFYEATGSFLSTMLSSLGLLPFTEKQLSVGKQNTFVPVATPSHRPGKAQGVTQTPLHHLFSILSSLPPGLRDDDGLENLLRSTLAPFLASKPHKAKVDLAHELMQSLPMDALAPYGPWLVIAEVLGDSLESSQTSHSSTNSTSQPPIGHEYREIIKHLERGLRSTPELPWAHWQSLFQNLVARASDESGEAGCAIAVIEPLAKNVLDILANNFESQNILSLFRAGIALISSARQPRDRQAVESARRRLWGTTISGSRSATFDTYDSLYKLMNQLLTASYERYLEFETGDIMVLLLTEVAGYLTRCNQLLVFKVMVILQNSIGIWIQDEDGRYNSRQSASVSEAVKLLWTRICNVFIEADNLEQVQLDTIEPLLCSAFESKHRHIVNTVCVMWNRAFEQADEIQYPDRLKTVLLSLRSYVDIVLPGLDLSNVELTGQQPMFVDSQDDIDPPASAVRPTLTTTPQPDKPSSTRRSKSNTPGSVKLAISSQRPVNTTPDTARLKAARRGATPRLRHDNSQIQFAAIASSSPIHAIEESQVLTERQKEVRERQQGNTALFPEIRSSIERNNSDQQRIVEASATKVPGPDRVTTPKSHRSFDDYVSSTPTPRRGQAPLIDDNDHEMTDDIPSSPPDPRRYPLVPEINKPLSSSSSVLDDWQFTSSPISGSPRLDRPVLSEKRTIAAPGDTGATGGGKTVVEEFSQRGTGLSDDEGEHADVEDEGHDVTMGEVEPVLPPITKGPSTPPNARGIKAQETPKSDTEVFVDALTSPAPHTPRARRALARAAQSAPVHIGEAPEPKDRSFDASDVDERSLLRLVVELDSRKCDRLATNPSEEPVKQDEQVRSSKKTNGSPVLDCITVNTESSKSFKRSTRSKLGWSSSPSLPPVPAEDVSSQEPSKKSRRKRKRVAETLQESGSKKHRHSQEHDGDVGSEPDSQLLQGNDDDSLVRSEISGEEQRTSSLQESYSQDQNDDQALSAAQASVSADTSMDESEAVNLQIVQEASQNTEVELKIQESLVAAPADEVEGSGPIRTDVDTDMELAPTEEEGRQGKANQDSMVALATAEEVVPSSEPGRPSLEKIMEAFRSGIAELRTAALSRDEVNQVEDMFMDIKRELYGAEFRGRN
ncbi:putative Rap1-interacting factor 1 N terminal-domain-containing protein [Seiridium unicorne]|uniref:Rap1-interacting factor 1 N terminal-domain-containing protein n=1 Tax=Seiridium unicorne TaxID=138068 RepID=A0ABR2VFW6_9PEZI